MSSIYGMIYNELGARIKNLPKYQTKIAKSVFDALDREAIADIVLDETSNKFWFESYQHGKGLTNRQYDWLVGFLEQHGYKKLA